MKDTRSAITHGITLICPGIETMEEFTKELTDVEDAFRQTTGQEMTKYYRPPQGIYSESNLEMAKELGYQTFFWESGVCRLVCR